MSLKKNLESLLLAISINFTSCNVFESISEDEAQIELRRQGYDPVHINACGPKAISNLLEKYNIKKEAKNISKEILENSTTGNILRNIFGLIDSDAMAITWPSELVETLQNNLAKYQITMKEGAPKEMQNYLKQQTINNKNGIALIKDKIRPFIYHYMEFPNLSDILSLYGNNTEVYEVYTVEEK